MRIKAGIIILGLALLTAACAGGPRADFGGPDPDGDQDEGPRPARTQMFISPAGQPFRAPMGQPYPAAAWFAQADADHDGRLTRDEFRADADNWFKTLDADKSGEISMPEVTHWENDLVPEITRTIYGGYGGGRGAPLKRNEIDTRVQGAGAYSLINEPHPIRGADADFSMGVSKAEWRAAADRRFDLLDIDKDGALLLADLPRTPSQGREPKKGAEGSGGRGGGPAGGGPRRRR